jgi:DtxR family manganese transport transcriptional regulator
MTRKRTSPEKNPFRRKRDDHAAETGEDYVELVATLIQEKGEARTVDLAARLGVTAVTVSRTVKRLEKAGLVRSAPYRSIFLTEQGQKVAEFSRERHDVVESFLNALGVPAELASQDSEGIEHHISEETLTCMRKFLKERS